MDPRSTIRRTALLGLGASLLAPLAGCGPGPEPPRPDVVLITLDTLRPDYLGFLGFERDTAPFLGRLAERMVVCEEAVSTSSWTAPSTASIFTGVYPDRHRVLAGLVAQRRAGRGDAQELRLQPIHPDLATLPERLAAAGYRTFGLASNPSIREELGFVRGFERFECRPKDSLADLAEVLAAWQPELEAAEPTFLYLHLNDVHAPYEPRAPWYERDPDPRADQRQRYLSEISFVDHHLEKLFERFGWAEEALVVIVSDHGEEFGDHGGRAHGFTLYGELNRALMMFRAPAPGFEPARIAARTSLIDVAPTVLELVGLEAPRELDGRSLADLGDPARRAALVAELRERTLLAHRRDMRGQQSLWAALHEGWKLIQDARGGPGELYDLQTDPRETRDVVTHQPQVAERLAAEILALRRRADQQEQGVEARVELDPELDEELRRLGYVDYR